MTILIFVLVLLLGTAPLSAQEIKPLYQLPEVTATGEKDNSNFLVGSDKGLFRVTSSNNAIPLWTEGRVDQIIHIEKNGEEKEGWLLRTTRGIVYTSDLKTFEERNSGLPFLTVKKYDGTKAWTEEQINTLEDLNVNPLNQNEIVTATKKQVYISRDMGMSWKALGSMSMITPGIKAVAVATLENRSVVFMSHPLLGFSYCFPDDAKIIWNDVDEGFECMKSLTTTDEISDIFVVGKSGVDGQTVSEIYVSQTYLPRIYRFNWQEKKAELIYKDKEILSVIDGLSLVGNVLMFTTVEGFGSVDLQTLESPGTPNAVSEWHKAFSSVQGMVNAAYVPSNRSGFRKPVTLNELWLLYPGTINTPYGEIADGKKSIYASAYRCRTPEGMAACKKILKDNDLNSVVIDMKDDYGLLRYDSKDSNVLKKAKTSMYALKLDDFVSEFKKDDIYLIARIVVFKDKNLASYGGARYAVWDKVNNRPWVGIKDYDEEKDESGKVIKKTPVYYDENWVDEYCQEVWEYNVQIANELISRGFDEIQFDYIRFPTDGYNLRNAQYRWQDAGMDKESALISFLSYARENINAPIGIDIYGANGWYRSGTRTGQDAETLCEYVDVIGPMFYPSHFEQTFLNYQPVADRTYRIYYYGTFRNTVICRNRAIIRPWVQAFYLNVSYDRLYYDTDYIQKQIFGVRDSVDHGYMYWNNSGDYSRLLPDIKKDTPFTGTAPEASDLFRKPALGTREKPVYIDSGISILDSVLHQNEVEPGEIVYTPFLQLPKFSLDYNN
ncbi:MAG: hypothetical protein MJ182_06510 [Treponema sp.]|nr:hypothetical protein [Treponema sp.]